MSRMKIEGCRNKLGFINLNKLSLYKEKGVVVEGSDAKTWFNVCGTRFLFKEYDDVLECFGEVLYCNAAKMCGMDCAEYDFAMCDGKVGTISYDFLNENEAYYDFLELTTQFGDEGLGLENVATDHDLLVIQNNKYNNLLAVKELVGKLFRISTDEKKDIELGLVEMYVLDTLFWHRDRTLWNYGLVIDESTDQAKLAKIHDNSHVLFLDRGSEYIESCIVDFISSGASIKSKYSSLMFDMDEDDSIEQLIEFYANSDEETRFIIERVINDFDAGKAIEETKNQCEIGDIPTLWIKAVLNLRQKTISKGLESVKINVDEAQMPSVSFSKRK